MSFEVLHSETIYQGPAFNVRQDKLNLPDGRQAILDVVDHNESVTIIPLDQNGMIWFIRQYRHAAKKHLLELPAGVMESGESPDRCAQRELREEIGMGAKHLQRIGGFFLAPGYSSEYMHIFVAKDLFSDPLPGDVDEFISIEKIPHDKAHNLAINSQIQDAKTLISIFWVSLHF
jgi:ADP-ribose pyrophosphatase